MQHRRIIRQNHEQTDMLESSLELEHETVNVLILKVISIK